MIIYNFKSIVASINVATGWWPNNHEVYKSSNHPVDVQVYVSHLVDILIYDLKF